MSLLLARERRAREQVEGALARAEAASRAKDEFLAMLSHELRNPLNAILGWSRILQEGGEDLPIERWNKGLEVIARSAHAQVELVDDMLDVARIVSGKLRLSKGQVNVREAIESCLDTVRSVAHAKGVVLRAEIEGEPGSIVADGSRVEQILSNLATNAVKFTPRGGVVTIGACRTEDAVVLSVRDTGQGIAPSFLPHVFDPFRQADGSTTRHGGLGLGLAIVRHLTELHGGTVTASSQGRGLGACFTVKLPLFAACEGTADEDVDMPWAPIPTNKLAGVSVLVVDDEEDMRDLVGMILEQAGARVVRVSNVEAAMHSLKADPPDVIVSDLAMPVEDGYALVRRLRQANRETAIPVVAMTAYARAEDRHRMLAAGFQRHVPKPIEPAKLVDVVAELAKHR